MHRLTIVNGSREPEHEVRRVIESVRKQVEQDFAPAWWMAPSDIDLWPERVRIDDPDPERDRVLGDGVIYLLDEATIENALGYHDITNGGLAHGYVFLDLARELGEQWSTTFSHEVLELLLDPECNRYAMGPHPKSGKPVLHWLESSDVVQANVYTIDGVDVSDFVLPHYFTPKDERYRMTHMLGTTRNGRPDLPSFGIDAGGYCGFLDPKTGKTETYAVDARGEERAAIKAPYQAARRAGMRTEAESPDR